MPSEYDALRESKRMAFKICDKEKVERFLDEKINEHKNRLISTRCDSKGLSDEAQRLTYWEHIKAINVNGGFDFKREFEEIWSKHSHWIGAKIDRIRKKCEDEWDKLETDLVISYDFLIKLGGKQILGILQVC